MQTGHVEGAFLYFQEMALQCMACEPIQRPPFVTILDTLERLQRELPGEAEGGK
jgi:hypothetical protein